VNYLWPELRIGQTELVHRWSIAFHPSSICALPGSMEEEQFDAVALDYNGGETTERTPMPHLYPSLESMPSPSTAAND
jgi:hypothetical protein